jgi:mRNA interferase HigB
MRLINKSKLQKLKAKNKGNKLLGNAIDDLISNIESNSPKTESELLSIRKDADCVHSDGFYFFDIAVHRTMILMELEEGEATVV